MTSYQNEILLPPKPDDQNKGDGNEDDERNEIIDYFLARRDARKERIKLPTTGHEKQRHNDHQQIKKHIESACHHGANDIFELNHKNYHAKSVKLQKEAEEKMSNAQKRRNGIFNRPVEENPVLCYYNRDIYPNEHLQQVKATLNNLKATEAPLDTIAMLCSADKKRVYIAANSKTRKPGSKTAQKKGCYDNFGLREGHVGALKEMARNVVPADYEIVVLNRAGEALDQAKPAAFNAEYHAEMQLLAAAKKDGVWDGVLTSSKTPCEKCHTEITKIKGDVEYLPQLDNTTRGTTADQISNWEKPEASDLRQEVITKPKSKFKVEHNLKDGEWRKIKSNVSERKADAVALKQLAKTNKVAAAKKVTKAALRPQLGGTPGSIIDSIVEHYDRPPDADTGVLIAESGSYKGRACIGVMARAVTAEAYAHAGVAEARANGPGASAGAHAGCTGVSAYAKAELFNASASVAGMGVSISPNLNTGASLGVDGLSASVAGFGFKVGPSVGVKTPIGDVDCTIM